MKIVHGGIAMKIVHGGILFEDEVRGKTSSLVVKISWHIQGGWYHRTGEFAQYVYRTEQNRKARRIW